VDQNQRELLVETGKNTWYKEKFAEGTYTLAVSAVNGTNESVISTPVTVQIVYPDVKSPTNLTHSIYNGNDLLLYWTKADHATSYNVYQVVDGKRQLITTTSKTSHYLSQLPEGDYVYEVTTVSDRFGESKSASPFTITLVHPTIQPPVGLTSSILNGNDVLLSWQKAEYAKEYQIYRVVDGKRELVATTTKTSHYFSQLPEADYQYEVTTVSDRFGESNEASQILIPLVHPVIQSPTGLTHTIYNGNDLLIYWQKADYAKEYKVYKVVDGKRELVATTTKTNHYFSQLPEGEFVYEVTTISDRFGESKEVSKVVIPLVYPEILPPAGLTHSIYNGNDVSLTWQKADYAKKYNIYRVGNGNRELVASTAETTYYFSQLPEDDYVYEVTTVSERFGESEGSPQLSVSVVYPEINAPLVALQMQNRDALLISWDKVDFANFYNVYKIVEGKAVFLAKTNSNAYSGLGLADGKHEYVVTTVSNRFGESPYSNKVVAEVKPKLAAPPASTPTVDGDDVTLSWEPVEGAGSYNIYEEIDGERVLVGSTTDPTLKIKDLEPGSHEFIIVPVAESGVEGSESTTVTVVTEEADVTPPVTSSNVEDKWLKESFIVKLTSTDDLSGVEKTYYSLNGSEYVKGSRREYGFLF
jgi:fibronectin type 3 domain-containing protein